MQSSHDLIKNEICYNEIIDSRNFPSGSLIAREFDQGIIQQSDGSLMACLEIHASDIQLLYGTSVRRRDVISGFLPTLKSGYEINFEWRRSKKEFKYMSCESKMKGSAREIEKRRRESFDGFKCYSNELFLTLVKRNRTPSSTMTREDLEEFCHSLQMLMLALSNADCACVVLKNAGLLDFIKRSMDLTCMKMPQLQQGAATISDCLLTEEYQFRNIPLVIKNPQKTYVSCLTVTALPSYTQPDLFGFCSYSDLDFRMVIKYKGYDKSESESIIEHKRKSYRNSLFSIMKYVKSDLTKTDVSDEFSRSALTGKEQCESALQTISDNGWTAGLCQISICIQDQNESALEEKAAAIMKSFQKQGILIKSERLGNSLCFLSMITGSKRLYSPLFVMSENFADMLHLTAMSDGSPRSKLLKERTNSEIPFIYSRNTDGSINYFSLYGAEGRKGHAFITGPTGSGKSVLLSLMAAQWLKYDNTRVVIIDRDLSSYRIIHENNGDFHYPMFDDTRFQPLENAQKNMAGCMEFIKAICMSQGVEFTAAEQRECSDAIGLMENGKETMTLFFHLIKGHNKESRMLPALASYAKGGEYERLFDSDEDSLTNLGRITMIETGKILQNSISSMNAALPFFVYLLSRLEKSFNDLTPTLLIIDEGWKALKNEVFSAFFEEWIKTLRKKNADVVLSITNLQDIIGTRICETVMSNMQTRIFFKDANAMNSLEESNYRSIGLPDHLISILPDLPDFCPLVLQEKTASILDFDMQSQLEYLTTPNEIRKKMTDG